MSAKNKEASSNPGFSNLDKFDFFCSVYLAWFVFAITIFFQGSPALENFLGISANYERYLYIYSSFLVIAVTTSTILGIKGTLKSIWRSIVSPVFCFYYACSFIKQCWKTTNKLKSNYPLKMSYFGLIPILYTLGATTTNSTLLNVLFITLLIHMFISLTWGVMWSLNPFDFLKYANFLKDTKIRSTFALNLVKLNKDEKELTLSTLLKKVDILKKFVTAYEALVTRISSNRALFSCFLLVLFCVSIHMILGGTILLRAGDLIAQPEGFIIKNKFFTGTFSDYLYIMINTFLPSEMYGIEFVNKDARWILTFVTMSSYLLLVIAIAGFSMAGTNKVEETVSDFTKNLHQTLDEAAIMLKEADEQKLIPQKKSKKKKAKQIPPPIPSQEENQVETNPMQ